MVPVLAAGAAAAGALTTTEILALIGLGGTAITSGAEMYIAKQAAAAVATRAAATVGLGAVAAAAVPWVVGGLTIYQLGKLGYKLLSGDDKNKK